MFLLPRSPWLLIFCLFGGLVFAPKMFSIWVHPCAVFSQLFTILLLPCLSWLGWLLSLQPSDSSCLPQGVFFILRQGSVAHSARCKLLSSFPGASQQQNPALGPLGRPHSLSLRRPPAATPSGPYLLYEVTECVHPCRNLFSEGEGEQCSIRIREKALPISEEVNTNSREPWHRPCLQVVL